VTMRATDVLTVGEALASMRSAGPLLPGVSLSCSPVGAELNVAIGLARLGHRASWVGRVGDDPFGGLAVRALRAEGVDVTGVVVDPSSTTATMAVLDRSPLPPEVVYHRTASAGSRLCPDDVLPPLEARPRLLHVTGITPALSPSAADAVTAAVARATDLGIPVSLDVNFRGRLWTRERATAAMAPLAARATLVVASEDELPLVAHGDTTAARASALLELGVASVVVKLGRRGAEAYGAAGHLTQPAFPVTEVDSIGAGDAFTAGYLSAYLDGLPEQQRLDRGCRAGAFAVSGRGDWERSPDRRELGLLADGSEEATR